MYGCKFENQVQRDFAAVFAARADVVYISDVGYCAFETWSREEDCELLLSVSADEELSPDYDCVEERRFEMACIWEPKRDVPLSPLKPKSSPSSLLVAEKGGW